MCIRRQEGCYLPKAVPQSLKNSTCAMQWSVPCPPLHHTKALHSPYQLRENRLCPICQSVLGIYVLLDLLTSFFPINLLVHNLITSLFWTTSHPMLLSWWSFSFQIHQPSYSCSTASPPPATVGLWQKSFAFLSVWRKATCQLSTPKIGSLH